MSYIDFRLRLHFYIISAREEAGENPPFRTVFDKFSQVVTILNSLLRVGIDVGSTTIKVVVLNKERELIYKKYARHFRKSTQC